MEKENTEFITKLFDQVKDSSDKTDREVERLSLVIRDLIISSSVFKDISDLIRESQKSLDEHDRRIDKSIEDISSIKKSLVVIGNNVSLLIKKVRTMVIIVVVTVSLMVTSYIFVRSSVENIIKDYFNEQSQGQIYEKSNTFDTLGLIP